MAFLVFFYVKKEIISPFSNSIEIEEVLLISSVSQRFEWNFIPYQDLDSSLRGVKIFKRDVTW